MRRISFLSTVLLIALSLNLFAKGVGEGPSFKGPLGLQLYSLRGDLIKNVPEGLKKARSFGFEYVELAGTYNLSADHFKKLLDENGLKPVANLIPFEQLRDKVDDVIRDAQTLGVKYVGCAWIPHQSPFDEKQARGAVDVFNKTGQALAKHGIKFYYHFHGFEFAPMGSETLADWMIRESDPKTVEFEMDVFWLTHGGQDPAKWLEKYGKRWAFMHVKDMKQGTKTGLLTGQSDVTNDVAIGTGVMDWKKILAAAKKAGVRYYFIEDESPTVTEQIPKSLKYLESLKW